MLGVGFIQIDFLGLKISIAKKMKQRFDAVDEALDDHLLSINENTNEIQTNYEAICELDAKIEKIAQRMDEMQMHFKRAIKYDDTFSDFSHIVPLNRMEQEAFLALYTADGLTFSELAMAVNVTEPIAKRIAAGMIRKGVPVRRELKGNIPAIALDPDFKDLQAKENLIEIDSSVLKKVA